MNRQKAQEGRVNLCPLKGSHELKSVTYAYFISCDGHIHKSHKQETQDLHTLTEYLISPQLLDGGSFSHTFVFYVVFCEWLFILVFFLNFSHGVYF